LKEILHGFRVMRKNHDTDTGSLQSMFLDIVVQDFGSIESTVANQVDH
jgi:hypothetical protein